MKRMMMVLLVLILCITFAACRGQMEPAGDTTQTADAPTVSRPPQTVDGSQETVQVPGPGDMPEKPDADASLPGNEDPVDQITGTQTH